MAPEPTPSEQFRNQVAVVTGASGGIGGAIALALARGGASVCAVGRDTSKLDALVTRIREVSAGATGSAMPTDLTDDVAVRRLTERVEKQYGRLDILVHCAGAIAYGKLEDAALSELDLQYAANVRGPYLVTQQMLPLLKKPRGQIVFINSSTGLAARANAGQYSATQHAFKALADALRDEVNADGIRVLSVYPGRTATPRIDALHALESRPFQPALLLQPEDVASVVVNALALPWTAEVTNVSIRPMQKSY